jgi:DNA-binding PadR family transcriptional regulator
MGGLVTRSTVDMAVLSVVIERPGHGYDIAVRVVSRFSPVYRTRVQNVYTNLKRLRAGGLVEPMACDLDESPDLHAQPRGATLRATAAGARTFREWLATPIPPHEARRELFTRLRALREDDYGTMLLLIHRYRDAVLGSLGFASIGVPLTVVDDLAREDHEASIEAQLRWADAAQEKLERLVAVRPTR